MDPDPGSYLNILLQSSGFFSTYGIFFLIIAILLLFSALISGTEVAYFSLTKVDLEELREEGGRNQKMVIQLLHKPRRLLATILIVNNLANVGLVLLSTFVITKMGKQYDWHENYYFGTFFMPVIEVGVITFILLFFGEITPKVYASQNKKKIASVFALPMRAMIFIFYPISFLMIRSTRFLDKRIKVDQESASYEDIKNAIDLTSDEESPDEEKEILKGIVNFSNTQVKSIMRARVDLKSIDVSVTFDELIAIVNDLGYSRLPVYEENLDKIKGILYIKDLLPLIRDNQDHPEWTDLIRTAYFIPESKKIHDLLDEFKQKRLHIAIVVDEFGGTSGIVTFEDIIEEIFGEINDEFDDDELVYSKLSETEYVFDGKIPLNDLIRITDIPDNSFDDAKGDADSLAGLVLEIRGKIPSTGDIIELDQFRFHIESVTKARIKRIKFVILQEKNSEESISSDK